MLKSLNYMTDKKLISQGAEAKVYSDEETVTKDRFSKEYRHPVLDTSLRKSRTRREAKVLEKLKITGLPTPELKHMDDKNMKIDMTHIPGDKLRDVLYKDPLGLGREIGCKIGIMHKNDIIHGDLTTSNMILDAHKKEINMIDFGLSFFSNKEEDKAVDLHLLRQALESKHYAVWESVFKEVIEGYQETYPDFNPVLNRFDKVENRGRNKLK